ncbi:DUF262 domain-containing protein [Glycomyces salinus]|uniref:DUF262 domain-containing protein n=1 Tax=Glycomyces salinus TaxID=980294 RepID=UPI0018EB82E3|nr:DUF262 domain-containing protein [Glycomyces salinus]
MSINSGLETQPSADTYFLVDLVTAAWEGKIRVPHFQRDFRWTNKDVSRLFDSIVKGYPIGSLLLWLRDSPAQGLKLGDLHIDAPAGSETQWVVDGQQRITSLANALKDIDHRTGPFAHYYDLRKNEFVYDPQQWQSANLIPLPVLFDLEAMISWFAEKAGHDPADFKTAQRIARKLREYRIPVYLVKQDDEKILTDIFDRMNNSGKRLRRSEIFEALFASGDHSQGEALTFGGIADRIDAATGFGRIEDRTVLSSLLARRGPDPSRDIRIEFDAEAKRQPGDFPNEDQDDAYRNGESALLRAVEFLQDRAGVPHKAFLAYEATLVVLTRFFAHFPDPSERTLDLLVRWYWRTAASGPVIFKGNFTLLGRSLSAKIKANDLDLSIQQLVSSVRTSSREIPFPNRFRTNEAATKITLCAWWSLGPRSFEHGEPFTADELSSAINDQKTAYEVVERLLNKRLAVERYLSPANHLLLPSAMEPTEEIRSLVGQSRTMLGSDSDADRFGGHEVLRSHLINEEAFAALTEGAVTEFLRIREQSIREQLRNFLERKAQWEHEDTPPLDSLDLDTVE